MSPGEAMEAPVACKANISSRGRKRRRLVGYIGVGLSLGLVAGLLAMRSSWYLGALVFLPMSLAGFGFFQASRNTCVARAKEGTFENDDFSTIAAPDDEVAASRKVAAGIQRDSMLLGVGAALASCAALFLRAGRL